MPPSDVVDLIMTDHREVERLFEIMTKQPETRVLHFPVLCALLISHSRAEESEVYPVAREEAGETDEVAHSQQEHAEAEELLEKMTSMDPTSSEFDKALQDLVAAVTHHVQEEESSVLPGIRQGLSDQRRTELADAFVAARAEHLGDRPGEATKTELQQQARNAGLVGVGNSSKQEIKNTLREQAESGQK
jgi:hemerythrin superfamily protein